MVMDKDNKRLGLGLDALFGSEKESQEDSVEKISIDLIKIAKWQPRKIFEEESLSELSASIKEYGVLQPIILRKFEDHYEIIAGERRFRASKMAGLHFIPSIVVDFDDKKSLEVSMIENLQRKDLSPIEKAEGFEFLINKLNMTQEKLSEKLGFSRSYITNFLRLNGLSDKIKGGIQSGSISVGHAKVLANKKNSDELAEKVLKEKLTVRQLENLVIKQPKKTSNSEEIKKFEQMLIDSLNAKKIEILMSKNSGKIIIDFDNLESLDEIISKICF